MSDTELSNQISANSSAAAKQIVLAHFIVSDDVERSHRFYTEVLGGTAVFSWRADLRRSVQWFRRHQLGRWTD